MRFITLTTWTYVVLLISTALTDKLTKDINNDETIRTNNNTDMPTHIATNITNAQPNKEPDDTYQAINKDIDLAIKHNSESFLNSTPVFSGNSSAKYDIDNVTTIGVDEITGSDLNDSTNSNAREKVVDLDLDGFAEDAMEQRYVDEAMEIGLKMMHDLYFIQEPKLYKLGLYLNENDPAGRIAMFSAPNAKAQFQSKFGYAAIQASLRLKERFPESRSRQNPEHVNFLRSSVLSDQCPIRGTPRCPPASKRYRTSDGTCNNLEHPWKGAAMLPMQRFLMPDYEDGIQSIRRSVSGSRLPSARELSIRIHRDRNIEMNSITMMFVQWGQFLDHDITSTAQSRAFNGSIPRCCARDGESFLPDEFMHPDCLPIPIPDDDWFLNRFGLRCMEFVRSAPSSRIDCDLGWREQINQVTSYIDASTVYGSDAERADSLRIFRHGLLQYGRPRQNANNPPDPPGGEICRSGAISTECFKGGDLRIGEQPGLTAFHTTWLRYHNRLAAMLGNLNVHWSDEKIYQETRRILGALIQHITYKEFLPIVLGHEVMELFDLNLLRKGFYTDYNENINPAPANAFSAAAFRFGHSLVQNSYVRSDSKHRSLFNNVSIHEEANNPQNIWSIGSIDRLILGFCNQASQRRDEFIGEELTNHLFQTPGRPFGMDLAAVNIQRGRDHGIPSYTAWREPCGLSKVRAWADLEPSMPFETIQRFRSLYEHVHDIDLYSGGLAERPVRGGVVGPTFACIIAQQFANLRKGDRFWYENGEFESSFTPAQLQQLRKVKFSQILCLVLPEIETVQPFVFLSPDNFRNSRISCDSPEMDNFDLRAWTERKTQSENIIIHNNIDNKIDNLFGQESKETIHKLNGNKNKNKVNVNNKLEFGDTKNRTKLDNKLDFDNEKIKFNKTHEKLQTFNKIENKIDLFGDEIVSTTQKNKNVFDTDFDVLFFTSNKGDKRKKPDRFTDFDIEQIFADPKNRFKSSKAASFDKTKTGMLKDEFAENFESQTSGTLSKVLLARTKRSIFEDTVDDFQDAFDDLDPKFIEDAASDNDEDSYDEDEEFEYDEIGRKKTKRKKKRTRTTTMRTTTKRHTAYFENKPVTSDFYRPLKIKVTNQSSATINSENKYGQSYTYPQRPVIVVNNFDMDGPLSYSTKRPMYNDDQFVLHETITKPNRMHSSTYRRPVTKGKPQDYEVNINIQYVASSTPHTNILIKKGDLRPNIHVIDNEYEATYPQTYLQAHGHNHNNKRRPLPIIPLRTTTKKTPSAYSTFQMNPTNGYYQEIYASTYRPKPTSSQGHIYEIKPNYEGNRPGYNVIKPSLDQNMDNYDQGILVYDKNRPNFDQNLDNFHHKRPSYEQNTENYEPHPIKKRPNFSNKRPSYEQSFDRPTYDHNRPTYDQNRPNFDQNRPIFDRPDFDQKRPNFDQNRPNFDQNRPNFDQNRPNLDQNRPSFDDNDYDVSTKRPPYNYDELAASVTSRPIQYNHDQFDDRPFSTSKRPYIYKPSEAYLSMFDEMYDTTQRPDYGQYFVNGYVQKMTTRRPNIPSYLFLQNNNNYYKEHSKDVPIDDDLKDKLHEVYQQLLTTTDKPDDSDIHYVGGSETDDADDQKDGAGLPDRYGDQGDRNFVKVSSVQGSRFLARGEKEHIIHTVQPKEGDLELFDEVDTVGDNPLLNGDDRVQVDVDPKQNRESDWILYNELDNESPTVEEPVYKTVLNETMAKELPTPFGQFWRNVNATDLKHGLENKNLTASDNQIVPKVKILAEKQIMTTSKTMADTHSMTDHQTVIKMNDNQTMTDHKIVNKTYDGRTVH